MRTIARVIIALSVLYIGYMVNLSIINHIERQHILRRQSGAGFDVVILIVLDFALAISFGIMLHNMFRHK
jgi:hypothetical protein